MQINLQSAGIFGTEMPPMKKLIGVFLLLTAAITRAALPQPDLIARMHYAGAQKISTDKNFNAFTNEFCSLEARALAAQTLDKLARAPYSWIKAKAAAGANDGASLLRPLGDDLLSAEWFFEARDTANGSPEYALAIHLNDNRAQVWSRNLAAVLQNWTGLAISPDAAGNWHFKKHEAPNLVTFQRQGAWVVIDCGQDTLSLGQDVLAVANRTTADKDWLSVDINWPRLAQSFPDLKALDLPETQLAVSAPATSLHIEGKFFYPHDLPDVLPAWQVPTNIIHEPFISFTAARSFASWLSSRTWARPYAISPTPDQLFTWGSDGMPFQTYMILPVADANDALKQVNRQLDTILTAPHPGNPMLTPVRTKLTNDMVTVEGIPFAAPYLQAIKSLAGHFLLAGGFPANPHGRPMPAELLRQLAQKNLVFYHWEITAERWPQVLQLTQLAMMLSWHKQLDANSAAFKWAAKISPTLGNTVTEAYQTAPDQLSFSRNAPGGLTAFEFIVLADWLEADDFPGCDLRIPALSPPRFKHFHPHPSGVMPAPPATLPAH